MLPVFVSYLVNALQFVVAALRLIVLFLTATPVEIITPEIHGTTDLLPEIIHTENTQIPVPEMTMAQCQGDTGRSLCRYKRLKKLDLISPGHQVTTVLIM